MMRPRATPFRPGFTLLEIILAIAISVALLAALYLALATHFYHAKLGRELLDEANLARSLFTRLSSDIGAHLGPALSQPAATVPATSDADSAETTTPMQTDASVTEASSGPFNLGVQGNGQKLTLSVSRLPSEIDPSKVSDQATVSDLRRITYWLVGSGDQALGLARQEVTRITGADVDSTPGDAEKYIIAPTVKNITFEYFDGTAWQPSWEGSTLNPDTKRPQGPPAAIAMTVTFRKNDKQYRHVVALMVHSP